MRSTLTVLVALAPTLMAGCENRQQAVTADVQQRQVVEEYAETQAVYEGDLEEGAYVVSADPYLVFDRRPSEYYSPQQFSGRQPWPVAENGYSEGSWTQFEERVIDREGWGNNWNNTTYRRFSSRKRGSNVQR